MSATVDGFDTRDEETLATTERSNRAASRTRRILTAVALCCIVLLPLAVVWIQPHAVLGGDWSHSLWMTAYIADYLRIYHHPPNVFATPESLGIAYPVFYGVLLYRLVGGLAILTDPSIGLRMLMTFLFATQTFAVYRAARALRAGRGIALLLCLATAASTYGLTNVYNRGDVAEQAGLLLLGTAVSGWFWSLPSSDLLESWFVRALIAASLTFLGGTHVVTLILGAGAFGVIGMLTLLVDRRRKTVITLGIAATGTTLGALIFFSEFASIGAQLRLTPGFGASPASIFADRIDAPFARFAPFPLDPQSVLRGLDQVSTPYLEAPIDYALLLFAAAVLVLRRDRLAIAFGALALALAAISVWPWVWTSLPHPLHVAGFAYRLTAYVNLFSLCAAFCVLWRLPTESRRMTRTSLPWIAGTLAVVACLIKLSHGYASMSDPSRLQVQLSPHDGAALAGVDATFTTIPRTGATAPPHVSPAGIAMFELGAPAPQRYVADSHGFIFTRILVLPWNDVIVDGRRITDSRKLVWTDYNYYGLRLRPRSEHLIETSFSLPPAVDRVIRLAEYALTLESIGTVVLGALVLRRRSERRREHNLRG